MKRIKIKVLDLGSADSLIRILKKKYEVELSETPDYLFYTANSQNYLDYNCVRICCMVENLVPDYNICDYAYGFDYMEFGDRYVRYPIYMMSDYNYYSGDDYGNDLKRAMHKHENIDTALLEKDKFCAFVYSNGDAARCRKRIFEALSQYKTVSSGGRYANNIGGPVASKLDFQSKCKFVIAFENSYGIGYTTEKIVHAFSAGAIPIYWGNPEITKEFNPASFINCNDYGLTAEGEQSAIDRIVERVKYLDSNDDAYLEMLGTPAFQNPEYVQRTQEKFEAFLYNIFDQPLEKAYRRNRFYWGERYERKMRIGNKFYWLCRKAIPIRDKVRKLCKVKKEDTL